MAALTITSNLPRVKVSVVISDAFYGLSNAPKAIACITPCTIQIPARTTFTLNPEVDSAKYQWENKPILAWKCVLAICRIEPRTVDLRFSERIAP